ncbi:hypothetical protein AFB00_27640 [Pseudonocardia sp. HH130630-07]|nr:hypothetical protein AFB00_27640 [Pseudonocardia sp. HH130630-07]
MDFRVLGALEVRRDDERIALPSPRHQRVLAALLMAPRTVVPLPRLVDAVWAEDPPATAVKQVQNCVSSLRGRLGDTAGEVIVTDGPGYRIDVADDQIDAHRFRRGVEAAARLAAAGSPADAVAECRTALALWRGPALDGLGSPALSGRAARWDEDRLLAIEQCTDWRFALGEHRAALAEIAEVAAEHPLRERTHGQLMTAFAGDGRQAEAIATFQQLRHRLADELGLDPGPAIVALHQRILTGADGTGPAVDPAQEPGPAPGPTPEPEPQPAGLDRAARELTDAITRQWRAETETRSLRQPRPVHLTWSSTHRPVAAVATADPAFQGDLSTLSTRFRELPARQLVVLGEAGAGKSVIAILLTLELLDGRRDDDPVPVLLPVASWNPAVEHLDAWFARRLREDHPGLSNAARYGPDAATALVLQRRVMPVLDGLDEIAPELHAAAIDALDRTLTSDRPVVVTCRADAYERAVHTSGALLSSAAVIEVDPVGPDAAVAFLTGRERLGAHRWHPVVEHLTGNPDGPLAKALRTPLMVYLARTTYSHPSADPAGLLDAAESDDRGAIEEHLLDAYLPTVYTRRPEPPARRSTAPADPRHDPGRAEAWLTFLARTLHARRTRDLLWWQLDRAVPRIPYAVLLGVLPALLFAVAGWVAGGPRVGLVYGLSFAVGGSVAHACGRRPGPVAVELRFRATAARFVRRFLVGAGIGTTLGVAWTLHATAIAAIALVFGLSTGTYAWLDRPVDVERVSDPRTVLRSDRLAGLSFTVTLAVSLGLFYGLAYVYTSEDQYFLVLGGLFDLGIAAAGGLAGAVFGQFLLGVWGAVGYGIACAVVGGQVFALDHAPHVPVLVGVLFGLGVGMAVFVSRAWGSFVVSRLWLGLRGHTPVRLMGFLDDAHSRGVLRQAGASYQFRHARLQDRLAARRP